MKQFRLLFVVFVVLGFCSARCAAQELEPLNPDWLANDQRAMELIPLLSSPARLTPQKIKDILGASEPGSEQDLGFGATMFEIRNGYGYTAIWIKALIFNGTIASYHLEIQGSDQSWSRIRERMIEQWNQNGGPAFEETEYGFVYRERNDSVLETYKAAIAAELGELKVTTLPARLRTSFEYLMDPMENNAVVDWRGVKAINALVAARQFDLLADVLRGPNPAGRLYAARALLTLNKVEQLKLSSGTVAIIDRLSSMNIRIWFSEGCVRSSRTPREILNDPDW